MQLEAILVAITRDPKQLSTPLILTCGYHPPLSLPSRLVKDDETSVEAAEKILRDSTNIPQYWVDLIQCPIQDCVQRRASGTVGVPFVVVIPFTYVKLTAGFRFIPLTEAIKTEWLGDHKEIMMAGVNKI